jgi:hypothetical protein
MSMYRFSLTQGLSRRISQRRAPVPASRSRRSLAVTLEAALDPGHAIRWGVRTWPRIPRANRIAVAEPLREVAALLRDPAAEIPESALLRVMAFASHPKSPVYGRYPTQAGFAAHALADEVRAGIS